MTTDPGPIPPDSSASAAARPETLLPAGPNGSESGRHLIVAAAWGSRGVAVASQFLAIRVITESIGVDGYAAFALLVGLQGWFFLADAGLGFSAQNLIAESRVRSADHLGLASVTLIGAALCSLALAPVWWLVTPFLVPRLFSSIHGDGAADLQRFAVVGGWVCLIGSLAQVVTRIWYGLGRGWIAHVVTALGQVVGLIALAAYCRPHPAEAPDIAIAIALWLGPTAIVPVVIYLALEGVRFPAWLEWRLAIRQLTPGAKGYWTFAAMSACVLQIDYLVLSQVASAEEITRYTIGMKAFGLLFFFFGALVTATGPTLTECLTRGDGSGAFRLVKGLLGFGFSIVALGTVGLVVGMPALVGFLVPDSEIVVGTALILILAAYHALRVWTDSWSQALLSGSILRPFLVIVPVQALVTAAAMLALAPKWGAEGVAAALSIGFLVTAAWWLPVRAHGAVAASRKVADVRALAAVPDRV